jgi:hypothetical protein
MNSVAIPPRGVLTCAHVLDDLKAMMKKKRAGAWAAFLHFVYPVAGRPMPMMSYFSFDVVETNADGDYAFLALRQGSRPLPVTPLTPIKAADRIVVGEEIGLCGYPHGSALLTQKRKGKTEVLGRFGPIVQRGCVSAVAPFDGVPPSAILLDLVTARAASGSPVFRLDTGEVIGMLGEGQEQRQATTSIAIPVEEDTANGRINIRGAWIKDEHDQGPLRILPA